MITHETRRQAYMEVLKDLSRRQGQVFTTLLMFPDGVTASELALKMYRMGILPTQDRNHVHPRLNEMVEMGIVEVIGKRRCNVTGKTVSVYKAKQDINNVIKTILTKASKER